MEEISVQMALLLGAGIDIKEEPEELDETTEPEASAGASTKKGRPNILGTPTTVLTRRDTSLSISHDRLCNKLVKEKLRNAAKQRIRRMCAPKRKRTDLAAPEWLAAEWSKGSQQKDELAEILQQVNWNKDRAYDASP